MAATQWKYLTDEQKSVIAEFKACGKSINVDAIGGDKEMTDILIELGWIVERYVLIEQPDADWEDYLRDE